MLNMLDIWKMILPVAVWLGMTLVEAREKEWYKTTTIYDIYTRSFKDSDGDGIGDIKGIHEKLDFIQSVGYETIWPQAIHKSPMLDMGYDISDFRDVDPLFGTLQDLKDLIEASHKRGMKVMLDFVPNHTSNESEWFKKSVNKEEPYTGYYVWKDPIGYDTKTQLPIPPNNWLSLFSGSMWEWNEKRRQFYLHQFSKAQPDLDYRNPAVREAMKDVLRFWLDIGVDAFRVDAIAHLVEDELLRDNPWRSPEMAGSTMGWAQIRKYTQNQYENYEVAHEWRVLLDEYKEKDNHSRIMAPETFQSFDELRLYFGNETYKSMHFPLTPFLPGIWHGTSPTRLNNTIHGWIDSMPTTGVPSWMMGNHDGYRLANRIFPTFSEAAFMIELLLPGVAHIYYGEEICMKNVHIRPDQIRDPTAQQFFGFWWTRDVCRSPMQWDDSHNAGFTTNEQPWLPVDPDYWSNNVKKQLEDPKSHLKTFKRLMKLRKSPVVKDGDLETCIVSSWLFMFQRNLDNQPPIVVIINMGTEMETACLNNCSLSLPEVMKVHTASVPSGYNTGDEFTISSVSGAKCSVLRPQAGVVLTTADNPEANLGIAVSQPSLVSLFLPVIASYFRYQY